MLSGSERSKFMREAGYEKWSDNLRDQHFTENSSAWLKKKEIKCSEMNG